MRKYIWPIFTIVLASLALAGCSDSSGVFNAAPVANHTDLSITYLGQVFGTVGNVLTGTTGQMLGKLFYRFNQGIIVVAGIWLAYTVFTMVIRSAQEGSFMGQNKNVALAFLKIAVGFALLIPSPTTGYSVLQDVVMKVVVEGVSLADTTWDYGLNYLKDGGSVWHRPENGGSSGDASSIGISASSLNELISKPAPVAAIIASEVCMAASNNAVDPNQQANPQQNSNMPNIALPGGAGHGYYDVTYDQSGNKFTFAGSATGTDPSNNSNCGVLSFSPVSGKDGVLGNALYQLIINLKPAAQKMYCQQNPSAQSCISNSSSTDPTTEIQQIILSAVINYANNAQPLLRNASDKYQTWLTNITSKDDQGWAMAGRYYWDLSQLESSMTEKGDVASYVPVASGPTVQVAISNGAASTVKGYNSELAAQLGKFQDTQNAGDTGAGPSSLTKGGLSTGGGIVGTIASVIPGSGLLIDFGKLMAEFSNGPGGLMSPDPVVTLHQIGVTSISIAGDLWFGLVVPIFAIGLIAAPANWIMNMATVLQMILQHIQPVLDITASAFWASGVTLGFYLPLYPFILFTFGVIGWLIAVIEAMVAAPLVCFGLTHPEGHDFLGEAKQALMLLLGVFLRPVLMVIGMIAGMILSYVSLRIVLYSFNGFIHDLFGSPSSGATHGILSSNAELMMGHALSDTSGLMGFVLLFIFVLPFVLAVFAGLVYVITTQCFSLIYVLPDNILRWIGAPQSGSATQSMMQQMGQGVSSGAQQSGQAAGAKEDIRASESTKGKRLEGVKTKGKSSADQQQET